jgi:hypothetical protein
VTTSALYREPSRAAWTEGVEGDAKTLSFDGVEPPPLGPVPRAFVLVWFTLAMLLTSAARQRARRRATGAPVHYVLRMTPAELSLSADGEPRGKSIALERITGFWGDRQIRVEVRDGAAIRLYCGLPGADYRALAGALDRLLTQVRESRSEASR